MSISEILVKPTFPMVFVRPYNSDNVDTSLVRRMNRIVRKMWVNDNIKMTDANDWWFLNDNIGFWERSLNVYYHKYFGDFLITETDMAITNPENIIKDIELQISRLETQRRVKEPFMCSKNKPKRDSNLKDITIIDKYIHIYKQIHNIYMEAMVLRIQKKKMLEDKKPKQYIGVMENGRMKIIKRVY